MLPLLLGFLLPTVSLCWWDTQREAFVPAKPLLSKPFHFNAMVAHYESSLNPLNEATLQKSLTCKRITRSDSRMGRCEGLGTAQRGWRDSDLCCRGERCSGKRPASCRIQSGSSEAAGMFTSLPTSRWVTS